MNSQMETIKCTIMRGGTSKGIFINKNELPKDPVKRDKIILGIFGSPDIRQIDGLGGADVLTSKLAIISPSSSEDADVDYTFGQVSFETDTIDYKGNCGNISSAVGPYAIDEGIVPIRGDVTKVRINLTNSHRILNAEVPVVEGKAAVEGNYKIDGVPGTGAKIAMDWSDTTGAFTGKLLPTGNPKDEIETEDGVFPVSLVDAGNPLIFIKAESLGLKGTEDPGTIEANSILMNKIERIRSKGAQMLGLVDDYKDATEKSPYNPFFAIISHPADYTALNDIKVEADNIDLVSRLAFMQRMHKAYPITGTVCTGAAARIPGSIVWDQMRKSSRKNGVLKIGHPGGIIDVEAIAYDEENKIEMKKIGVYRTARRIMDGNVYVKKSLIKEGEI